MTVLSNEELAWLDRIAADAIEPVEPPPAVRAAIMDAVRRTPQLDTSVPGAHESRTVREAEGKWSELAPGARMKKLSRDARRNTLTFLVDLDPHALLPAHDHEGNEDTYVVRGSCQIGALGLNVGDFHHADGGAHHGDVVATSEGCLLLVTVDCAAA